MDTYTGISEAARRYNVSKRALRYYEEIGLLDSTRREGSNYRCYTADQLTRLEQILLLKNLGFTMTEVGNMLQSDDRLIARGVLEEKRKELSKEIDALTSLKTVMETMLMICDEEGSAGFGVRRLLREHPYLHTSIERRMYMIYRNEDMFVIEFGSHLIPYAADLMEGIKALRTQLEKTIKKELPLVRIRDSEELTGGKYRILVNGETAAAGDFGEAPGKSDISVLLDRFQSVVSLESSK